MDDRKESVVRPARPRIVTGALLGIAFVLVIDGVLLGKRIQYGRELERMHASLTEAERKRVDAMAEAEENHLAIAAELARREALGDIDLHLAVDADHGVLYLEHRGARLREMQVRLGPAATVGTAPDVVVLAPPLGRRSVARVVDGAHDWAVPVWVWADRGLPIQGDGRVSGALGPLAIFLDSGAVIYARPAVGPLRDPAYVLPGSVRAEAPDLEAIRDSVQPGMPVYFY